LPTFERQNIAGLPKTRELAPCLWLYEKMSALLDEIIAARKAKAIEYEKYLRRIAELAKKAEARNGEDTPR
jgi:hypothetical protein